MPITSIKKADPSPHFKRSFTKLPSKIQKKVVARTALFETNPQHPSLRIHKLRGKMKDRWSFSIDRHYRVAFKFVDGDQVVYLDVGDHKVYR